MKKFTIIIIGLALLTSNVFANVEFSDVATHWSSTWVKELVSKEITSGYPDGTFKPDNTVSIEEFITFTVRTLQSVDPIKYEAIDEGGYWANKFVKVALENKLIEEDQFTDYSRNITREEMTSVIMNANNLIDNTFISVDKEYLASHLDDYYSISEDYSSSMLEAFKGGFITGKGKNNDKVVIDPKGTATRAEAAVLLIKLIDSSKREALNDSVENDSIVNEPVAKNVEPITIVLNSNGEWVEKTLRPITDKNDVVVTEHIELFTGIREVMDLKVDSKGNYSRVGDIVLTHIYREEDGMIVENYSYPDSGSPFHDFVVYTHLSEVENGDYPFEILFMKNIEYSYYDEIYSKHLARYFNFFFGEDSELVKSNVIESMYKSYNVIDTGRNITLDLQNGRRINIQTMGQQVWVRISNKNK